MKNSFTLFLLMLSAFYCHSQSFIDYHNTCNSACELMSKGKYKAATDSLKKAISSVDKPFAKDIFNLAKCYSQLNEKDSCIYYLETAMDMMDINYLLESHKLWFEPLLGIDKWSEITSRIFQPPPLVEKQQIILIEKLRDISKLDQHYRKILTDSIKVWHYDDTTIINIYRDSVKYNDEIAQKEMEDVINTYGWPCQEICNYQGVNPGTFLVHASDAWFQKMNTKLLHEIEIGNLSPNNYAMIADRIRLRNNLSPLYNSYSAFNNELTEEVANNCRKIGLALPQFRDCR
ncbi:MAG: hypothetical protein RJQ00_10585 [Vicingaceae bacterium]